jgi:hypothetical protein
MDDRTDDGAMILCGRGVRESPAIAIVRPRRRHRAVFYSQITSPNVRRFAQPLTNGSQRIRVYTIFSKRGTEFVVHLSNQLGLSHRQLTVVLEGTAYCGATTIFESELLDYGNSR